MYIHRPLSRLETHDVTNQAKPLSPQRLFTQDLALSEAVARWGERQRERLKAFGERAGSEEVIEWGAQANRNKPTLHLFDRFGHRIDQVDFHPAYHELMSLGVEAGLPSVAWTADEDGRAPEDGHLAHSAMLYMLTQVEPGVCCPLSMTYACAPVLQRAPELKWVWEGTLVKRYDSRLLPAQEKLKAGGGLTIGMAMTEKQGGSDVRANSTSAAPLGGLEYSLTGHKWFCSAPMSDGFLTLAQAEGGLTCFFVPRWRPDGDRNGIRIQRLKDKLGNHANASSEIEYVDAWAHRVGDEGRGVRTIIEMVNHTRLDASLANAGLMRQALSQALNHCAHRSAFGARLIQQPLMRAVLADLLLESEAATQMTMRVAHAFDAYQRNGDEQEGAFARLAVAVTKFWVCKRTPDMVVEALECHGGAGYVEESPMPRLYREAPLNGIWEGSGNVMCLDVLRALQREPEAAEAFFKVCAGAQGAHPTLDAQLRALPARLHALSSMEPRALQLQARSVTSDLAVTLQAALLALHSPPELAQAYCQSRLSPGRRLYGDWGSETPDLDALLSRAEPLLS